MKLPVRCADPPKMETFSTGLLPLGLAIAGAIGFALFLLGGLRFRRWAVEDRPGIPRYSETGETVFLWIVYSGLIALIIVLVRQTMRHL
ncbi:MAG: hypothetical protein AB8G23_03465 [Myxococcota bacterium]